MKRKITIAAALATATVTAVSACGSDSRSGKEPAARTPAMAPTQERAQGTLILMASRANGNHFNPANATATVGETVTFKNPREAVVHTVTSTKGEKFDSGRVRPGDVFEFRPTKIGKINYVCRIHPGWGIGTITVE